MRIVIIEDEIISAEDLVSCINKASGNMSIKAVLQSVKEAAQWLKYNTDYDIIFSDIQLNDGTSFDLFKQIQIEKPVVFCTAYDEFALEAFKHNGIDYILKPFTQEAINAAIKRIGLFKGVVARDYSGIEIAIRNAEEAKKNAASILINYKNKIIPVKISDIAFFYTKQNVVSLVTFLNQKYLINNNLEELEQLAGQGFYRANRQYLVSKEAVLEMEQYFNRKLLLKLKIDKEHEIIINKIKVTDFLNWLKN